MNVAKKLIPFLLVILVVVAVIAILPGEPVQAARPGGGIQCPMIYAPVICDGGKIYSNQCFADKAHARNCVPYGDI